MSHPFAKRLMKEYSKLKTADLSGIGVVEASENLSHFIFQITIEGQHEVYREGDVFQLELNVKDNYPIDPPAVKFIETENSKIPIHPHIYSNGHICLNILGKDWSPACSLQSVILSLQSMLYSNTQSVRPPDDVQYSTHAPKDPSATSFVYHDDNV